MSIEKNCCAETILYGRLKDAQFARLNVPYKIPVQNTRYTAYILWVLCSVLCRMLRGVHQGVSTSVQSCGFTCVSGQYMYNKNVEHAAFKGQRAHAAGCFKGQRCKKLGDISAVSIDALLT